MKYKISTATVWQNISPKFNSKRKKCDLKLWWVGVGGGGGGGAGTVEKIGKFNITIQGLFLVKLLGGSKAGLVMS